MIANEHRQKIGQKIGQIGLQFQESIIILE